MAVELLKVVVVELPQKVGVVVQNVRDTVHVKTFHGGYEILDVITCHEHKIKE